MQDMVKRGLGKGFDALIPTDLADFSAAEKSSDLREVLLDEIVRNPNQPRREFDADSLQQLADSIRVHGVLQPLVLAPAKGGKYEIVAGERRFRAAKLAQLKRVPAIIRTLSDQHKAELAIIENVQRTDLNPMEVAISLAKLRDDFSLTVAEIAKRVGKNASTVSNVLRLVDLPETARRALEKGEISEGHARQILALPDEKSRTKLLNSIRENGWSVRKAEQFVLGSRSDKTPITKNATSEHTELTNKIAHELGLKPELVSQKITAHGGEIRLKFTDENDLLRIRRHFAK